MILNLITSVMLFLPYKEMYIQAPGFKMWTYLGGAYSLCYNHPLVRHFWQILFIVPQYLFPPSSIVIKVFNGHRTAQIKMIYHNFSCSWTWSCDFHWTINVNSRAMTCSWKPLESVHNILCFLPSAMATSKASAWIPVWSLYPLVLPPTTSQK